MQNIILNAIPPSPLSSTPPPPCFLHKLPPAYTYFTKKTNRFYYFSIITCIFPQLLIVGKTQHLMKIKWPHFLILHCYVSGRPGSEPVTLQLRASADLYRVSRTPANLRTVFSHSSRYTWPAVKGFILYTLPGNLGFLKPNNYV